MLELNGFSRLHLFAKDYQDRFLWCRMDHYAENTVTTAHYGEKFDLNKIEVDVFVSVHFYPPKELAGNGNAR